MINFSVSEVLERAWDLTKKYGIVLIVIYIAIEIVKNIIGRFFSPEIDSELLISAIQDQDWTTISQIYTSNPLGSIITAVLGAVLMLGFTNCVLQLAKGTANDVSLDHWKQDVSVYVNYVVIEILINFIIGIGLCMCILPGLYLWARLGFASTHAIDCPKESFMDHIKASWNMTRGNVMNLILLAVAEVCIIIVGLMLCCIGIIPAAVLCALADVTAYVILSGYNPVNADSEFVA